MRRATPPITSSGRGPPRVDAGAVVTPGDVAGLVADPTDDAVDTRSPAERVAVGHLVGDDLAHVIRAVLPGDHEVAVFEGRLHRPARHHGVGGGPADELGPVEVPPEHREHQRDRRCSARRSHDRRDPGRTPRAPHSARAAVSPPGCAGAQMSAGDPHPASTRPVHDHRRRRGRGRGDGRTTDRTRVRDATPERIERTAWRSPASSMAASVCASSPGAGSR